MSTLDSSLNSSATVFTIDFYKRILNRDADDRAQLKMVRVATAVIGVIATFASLIMVNAKTALDVWWQISAIFGGGMLGLFLSAILMPKLQSRQAMLAVITGLIFIAWATATKFWFTQTGFGFPLHTMMIGVVGTLLTIFTAYLLYRFSKV